MNKLWLLLLLSLVTSGCFFRFSDPTYTFKELEADEPPGPEFSLLMVTVKSDPGLLGTPEFFSLWFRRVDPHGSQTPLVGASSKQWYRALRPRTVKNGHFLIMLPPGVYELEAMRDVGFLGREMTWHVSGDAKIQSRIHITRPGIYDLGTLRVTSGSFTQPAMLAADGDGFSAERLSVLRAAVKGKSWERYLLEDPTPQQRKKRLPPAGGTIAQFLRGDRT